MTSTFREIRDRSFQQFMHPLVRAVMAKIVRHLEDRPHELPRLSAVEWVVAARAAAFVQGLACAADEAAEEA